VRNSLAKPRHAVVADALGFVAICAYLLGYQRQLGADALLTFADKEKPAQDGLGLVLRPAPECGQILVTGLETFWQLLATQIPSRLSSNSGRCPWGCFTGFVRHCAFG
jgi:hypothetical protein